MAPAQHPNQGALQPVRLRWLPALVVVVVLAVSGSGVQGGENEPDPTIEYQVKAGFLANFGKLTE